MLSFRLIWFPCNLIHSFSHLMGRRGWRCRRYWFFFNTTCSTSSPCCCVTTSYGLPTNACRAKIPAQVLNDITVTVTLHCNVTIKKVSILLPLDTLWKMSYLSQLSFKTANKYDLTLIEIKIQKISKINMLSLPNMPLTYQCAS